MQYITRHKDRLDKIAYEAYGSSDSKIIEAIILANPGLETRSAVLPVGISIVLPNLPAETKIRRTIKQIRLWD